VEKINKIVFSPCGWWKILLQSRSFTWLRTIGTVHQPRFIYLPNNYNSRKHDSEKFLSFILHFKRL